MKICQNFVVKKVFLTFVAGLTSRGDSKSRFIEVRGEERGSLKSEQKQTGGGGS